MHYLRRLLGRVVAFFVLLALAAAAGAAAVIAWAPAIAPIEPPDHASLAREAVARGATLVALGDCAVCHTVPNGRPYAGGRGVATPFGTVYATNITPDPETGIGRWSLAAFRRTMRDGIDREGRHLYPVLPYPHFTRASDDDIAAMYAFLMTREPVAQAAPPNDLAFPFKYRPLIAAWNLLFLHPGPWESDPSRSSEWNRGAYLVDAIGHCGACHSPRNLLGAEENRQAFSGGEAEDWDAPSLRTGIPAPWSVEALTTFLRTGLEKDHGVAAGPMAPVTHQLATVPDADVHAIAVYIASLMRSAPASQSGAARAPARAPAANPTASQPTPAQPAGSQSTPAQPARGQSTAAQPPGSQSTATQPTASQPTPAQSAGSQPTPAQPAESQPTPAQPPGSQSTAAQPAESQPTPAQSGGSQPGSQPTAAQPAGGPKPVANASAAAMFDGACGACHAPDAPMTRGGAPSLAVSTAVNAPSARNVVGVILHGLPFREGRSGPYMPAFAGELTDAQVAALAEYVRARYSDQAPWRDVSGTVRDARRQAGG